jgi:hypothetical protein
MLSRWKFLRRDRRIVRICAIAALAIFLATSFRAGWNRATTDFPNYYTAAVLVTKGARLRNYYDWPWFQKQMNYAGVENQLGGYIPQTPLTMLPMVGVATLEPQTAKRVWLLSNLAFLGAAVWLLALVTGFSPSELSLLTFAGYGTLHANFLLGQYYVFLLFLLVLAFYCLTHQQHYRAGSLLGAAFVFKLYGGPLLFYLAAKRNWRPLAGMGLASAGGVGVAALLFGWHDLAYFVTHILPRAIDGETLDPYNSGNGTVSTLLRRTFVMEPELNPHPVWNFPVLFFFLQPFFAVLVLALPLFCARRGIVQSDDFAWFYIAMILASPNTASYTFILLLLPVALLLEKAGSIERAVLICCYAAVSLPMRAAWSWLFPKVWLLLALFYLAGRHSRLMKARHVVAALAIASAVAAPVAWRRLQLYRQEPGRRWEHVALQQGAIYSSSPATLRRGIVYESIGKVHYVLRWFHDGENEELAFPGEAFRPLAQSPDGPIQFEFVRNGRSTEMVFDLFTRKVARAASSPPAASSLSVSSPDGQWIASVASTLASRQLWLSKPGGGRGVLLAGGNCNNFSPSWALDSKSIVFASDCDRGLGLPGLYRARLDRLEGFR